MCPVRFSLNSLGSKRSATVTWTARIPPQLVLSRDHPVLVITDVTNQSADSGLPPGALKVQAAVTG
jgi:hypothetical protein